MGGHRYDFLKNLIGMEALSFHFGSLTPMALMAPQIGGKCRARQVKKRS